MARTSGDFVKAAEATIELSVDGGSTWTNYSSYGVTISSSSTAVEATTFKVLDGTSETVDGGGDPAESITIGMIFVKEAGTDLHSVLFDKARAADKSVDVRWSRKDAASGESIFTSSSGKCTSCPPPPFDASNTDVVRIDATIEAASVARSVIA